MMNTSKLAGRTLITVIDDMNGAIEHALSNFEGTVYKVAEQVTIKNSPTNSAMANTKSCEHTENENARGTIFLPKMRLPYLKNGSNTPFSLPLNASRNHIPYNMVSYSTSTGILPVPPKIRNVIADSALRTKYDGLSSDSFLRKFTANYSRELHMTQLRRMMSARAANRDTIEGIIITLNDKFNADIVNDTQAIYQFNITSGDKREIYHIDLRNGSGSAGKGKSEGSPDTIFSIDAENFNNLVSGNLKAPTAFKTGRMKISGSMQKAAKLEKLFITLLDK